MYNFYVFAEKWKIIIIVLQEGRYSTEELSTAVITSCACALILGFIAGFLVARHGYAYILNNNFVKQNYFNCKNF